jgi:phosphoserine phosphatase
MTDGMARGGWRDEVYERLAELLRRGSADSLPVVFDFDNTCILGDIGELFSHFLIDEMLYRYDLEGFWELIHPDDGREELRRVTEAALSDRRDREAYELYLAQMGALYGRRLVRAGARDCYEWAVRLHVGLRPEEVRGWTKVAIQRELKRVVEVEQRRTEAGEEVRIGRGIRLLREMGELIAALRRAGFDVWIVSATNLWSVQVFAAYFGVPPERVLGNRVRLVDGVMTGQTQTPVLFREGKVAIIDERIGRRPALVAGDSVTDLEMLEVASEVALVIDGGSGELRAVGEERGWAIQPQGELTAVAALEEVTW